MILDISPQWLALQVVYEKRPRNIGTIAWMNKLPLINQDEGYLLYKFPSSPLLWVKVKPETLGGIVGQTLKETFGNKEVAVGKTYSTFGDSFPVLHFVALEEGITKVEVVPGKVTVEKGRIEGGPAYPRERLEVKTWGGATMETGFERKGNAQIYLVPGGEIKRGESGSHVMDLQRNLVATGDFHGVMTGVIDKETLDAVQSFMERENIPYAAKDKVSTAVNRLIDQKVMHYFRPLKVGDKGDRIVELTTHLKRWGLIDQVTDDYTEGVGKAVWVFRKALGQDSAQTHRGDVFSVDSRGFWAAIHAPVRDVVLARINNLVRSGVADADVNSPTQAIPKLGRTAEEPEAITVQPESKALAEVTPDKGSMWSSPVFWLALFAGYAIVSSMMSGEEKV